MNELALFAGAGGGLLASRELGWRTVCAVEIDLYCRRLLLQRQLDGELERFPVWDDCRTFVGTEWRGLVDVVSAGFPCQPFSLASGNPTAERDERNMWPDTIRIIREVQPRFCFLENVTNLLTHEYAGTVFGELAESGYCVRWDCVPASACGADHCRDRLWIVAYAISERSQRHQFCQLAGEQYIARHAAGCYVRSGRDTPFAKRCSTADLCRKSDAVAGYVDRLKALGNGWVPSQAVKAWKLLTDPRGIL